MMYADVRSVHHVSPAPLYTPAANAMKTGKGLAIMGWDLGSWSLGASQPFLSLRSSPGDKLDVASAEVAQPRLCPPGVT
ncbi:hypothetical protein BDFG_03487 [Blastomyces dermatitidis ATCC 26199]|nr:hypothetical protein BDFG_03487 [Blastomyces dermatitidis ATCC 26199]